MSLLVASSSNSQPQPLPSLPPSPTSPSEEDLGGASLWHDADEEEAQNHERLVPGNVKGKERAREISLDEEESEDTSAPALDEGYPPQKDEEEESRKIEENLKRLEQVERQRRKAARDSVASVAPSSVVNNVSRRASLLWTGRKRSGSGSASNRTAAHNVHTQLGQSSEDALPLSDLHGSSNSLVSPGASKPPSPTSHGTSAVPVPTIIENPFEMPDSATPLRGFPNEDGADTSGSAVMRPSSPPPPTPAKAHASKNSPFDDHATERPTLQASPSFSRPQPSQLHHPLAPPPLPLDLPPPKTPPPRTNTPGGTPTVTSPPGRVRAPSSSTPRTNAGPTNQDGPEQEHRWWTDWLCGCREEKDRDNAGRTNPFE